MSLPLNTNSSLSSQNTLYQRIKTVLESARKSVLSSVNRDMVITYFEIGKSIVEVDQKGQEKAEYSRSTLKELSQKLITEFGKGFSVDNLENMRKFYLVYRNSETLSRNSQQLLGWSHYVRLIKVEDQEIRSFYEVEARKNNWSYRELDRQINLSLYERLAVSRDKNAVQELSQKGQQIMEAKDLIKDPYVLEFLGLKEEESYSESDLESKLIDKLEDFLLELGKGFTFVARQQRISFGSEHFYIDLVFYNYLLKCFLIIDLKVGKLKHQDLGQLQMNVNYYDRDVKPEGDNPTIGLILSADKEEKVVEYTLPEDNKQIFASKYKLYLPSKEELEQKLDELTEEE